MSTMETVIKPAEKCPLFLVTHSPQNKKQKRPAGTITQAANFAVALHYEKKVSGGETTVQVTADSKAGGLPNCSMKLVTEGPSGDPESEALVSPEIFDQAQKRFSAKDRKEKLLEDLRTLLQSRKRLTARIIQGDPQTASPAAYYRNFGGLRSAINRSGTCVQEISNVSRARRSRFRMLELNTITALLREFVRRSITIEPYSQGVLLIG